MDYFFLKWSSDQKSIGKYPQSEKMCGEDLGQYIYSMPNSVRWIPSDGPLKINPKVDCFELKYHSKLTDCISTVQVSSPAVLIISEQFYDLLQQFSCMPSSVFQCQILHRSKKYPYRFLYFPQYQNHFVDFRRSRFMLSKPIDDRYEYTREEIYFNSFDEYLNKYQSLEQARIQSKNPQAYYYIQVTDLYFNESIVDLDLFRLFHLNRNFIISTGLKNAIEQKGFTGLEFIPAHGAKIIEFDTNAPRRLIY